MEVHQAARKELSARGCLISLSKTMESLANMGTVVLMGDGMVRSTGFAKRWGDPFDAIPYSIPVLLPALPCSCPFAV